MVAQFGMLACFAPSRIRVLTRNVKIVAIVTACAERTEEMGNRFVVIALRAPDNVTLIGWRIPPTPLMIATKQYREHSPYPISHHPTQTPLAA